MDLTLYVITVVISWHYKNNYIDNVYELNFKQNMNKWNLTSTNIY